MKPLRLCGYKHGRLVHPGEILLHMFLREYDIFQNALARAMGISPRRVNEIVLGKRAITADTAVSLEAALGIEAEFWMELQAQYEIDLAREYRQAHPRDTSPLGSPPENYGEPERARWR